MCEEVLHGPSGAIVSPDNDGDGFYDDNVYCNWLVIADENHVIRYEFIYFDVESSDSCAKDRVLVGFIESNANNLMSYVSKLGADMQLIIDITKI